jgi:hypothetical protein
MIESLSYGIAKDLIRAWQGGSLKTKVAIVLALLFIATGTSMYLISEVLSEIFDARLFRVLGILIGGAGVLIGFVITTVQRGRQEVEQEEKIKDVERRVKEHPQETQAAWDLARIKLETYLDRNISQVRSIFWLTVLIMICGFALISIGAFQAFADPSKFNASVLTSVSGVVVSFIGGTFLVLYKSTMAQAQGYVVMLERINAVGMSVKILDTLDDGNKELKHKTIADVATQLLAMYSIKATMQTIEKRKTTSEA